MTKYTELSKKERNAIRYAKRQVRYREQQAKKTRPSDRRPPNQMDGISGKSNPQTAFVSQFPTGTKKFQDQLQSVLNNLFRAK